MRRLSYILLGVIAGLGVALSAGRSAEAIAALVPTPTAKVCHVCDETVEPEPTATVEAAANPAGTKAAVVRAVLFWTATCPHCHHVLNEVLPPLQQKYGSQLEVLLT